MDQETFDFIVAGAGSAGCAVAARLSESRRYRVLLVEAGGRDRYPWIHIPVGYHKLFTHDRLNWKFESEPIPGLNGRTSYQPRGKMLGGTSSLNGMVYMRGTLSERPAVLPKSRGPGAGRERVPWRRRPAEGDGSAV
jgi:choline dehydrogenase